MKYGVLVGILIAGFVALFVMAPDAQGYNMYGYRKPGSKGSAPYPGPYAGPYGGGYNGPSFSISF